MLSRIAFILKRPTDHVLCSSSPHECRSHPITLNYSRTVFFRRLLFNCLGSFPDSLCSVMGDIAGLVQFLSFCLFVFYFPITFAYISHVLLYFSNQISPARYLTRPRSELVSLFVVLSSPFATVDLVV